eukprot:765672-Hanusia_phi.AAC.1
MKLGGSTSSTIARAMKLARSAGALGVSSDRSSRLLKTAMNPSKNCSLPYTRVIALSSTEARSRSLFFFSMARTMVRFTASCPDLLELSSASDLSASTRSPDT